MRAGSFDVPPFNGKAIDQLIDQVTGVLVCVGSQVGIFGGRQDGSVAQDLLDLEQIDTRFNQKGCVTVTKVVRSNLFFIPQVWTTLRRVFCTPPRSNGVVAR